jgi:hypothetical protein
MRARQHAVADARRARTMHDDDAALGRIVMRSLVSLISLGLAASCPLVDATPAQRRTTAVAPASRTPAVNLAPILPETVPEACRALLPQTTSGDLTSALRARSSLAGCIAHHELAGLALCDCAESIAAVEEATARSFELLDEASAAGDPATTLLAEHARARLYGAMRVRMMSTIPLTRGGEDAYQLRDARRALLEAQLDPWKAREAAALARVVELAEAHPNIARTPVIAAAIEASRTQLRSRVAGR